MTGKNHVLVNLYPVEVAEGYESLFGVLQEALNQAQFGKGHERYAEPGKPFHAQDACREARELGLTTPIHKAREKAEEALHLDPNQAIDELVGAINYLAAAVIVIEETKKKS